MTLRIDARRHGKLTVVDNLGDFVLMMFYEEGAEPSIDGLLRASEGPA